MEDIFLDFLFQFSLIFYFLYFFLFSIFFFLFVLFCYILKIFHSTIFQFHLFANFPSQYLSDCFCRQNFHKKTKSSVWENMQKDPRFHFVVFNYWLIALGKKKSTYCAIHFFTQCTLDIMTKFKKSPQIWNFEMIFCCCLFRAHNFETIFQSHVSMKKPYGKTYFFVRNLIQCQTSFQGSIRRRPKVNFTTFTHGSALLFSVPVFLPVGLNASGQHWLIHFLL